MNIKNLLISSKHIYIDYDIFLNGGRLFIIGFAGSGKTTISKLLTIKYPKKRIFYLDDIWDEFLAKDKLKIEYNNEAKMNNKVNNEILRVIYNNRYDIVEGVNLVPLCMYDKKAFNIICNSSIIIMGTSALESSIRSSKRDYSKNNSYIDKFGRIYDIFDMNFVRLYNDIKNFYDLRVKCKDNVKIETTNYISQEMINVS